MNIETTKKRKTKKGYYRDIYYESDQELWFLWWACELMDRDFIISISRADSYNLTGKINYKYTKATKKGIELKEKVLFNPHSYNPDYNIMWNNTAENIFYWHVESDIRKDKMIIAQDYIPRSIIEVKPDFDQHNMEREARINIKWVYKEYEDIISVVKPKKLFEETFTPMEYIITKTGKERKIKWKVKTVDDYIKENMNGENLYKCTSVEG